MLLDILYIMVNYKERIKKKKIKKKRSTLRSLVYLLLLSLELVKNTIAIQHSKIK